MDDRTVKRLIIGLVYLIVFAAAGYGIFRWIHVEPTCMDSIQNQGEEGVDCGSVCGILCAPAVLPLQAGPAQVLAQGQGTYDVVASIVNPNTAYGASRLAYQFVLKDAAGATLLMLPGTSYILPGQSRWIIRTAVKVPGDVASAELALGDVQWQKADATDFKVDFPVRREAYATSPHPNYEGVLFNNSDFDFERVDVAVVLTDAEDRIVGVNTTAIATFLSHTERAFTTVWTAPLPAAAVRQRVQASTNVFENANFIRRYGTQEKFQEF